MPNSLSNSDIPGIHFSIISHGQWPLVKHLLGDLSQLSGVFQVTLTFNIPEEHDFKAENYDYPVRALTNRAPKGFGKNHNQAFEQPPLIENLKYFAVVNPDIRIKEDVFPQLLSPEVIAQPFNGQPLGILAPRIQNNLGEHEDSAREIPTPYRILRKALKGRTAWTTSQHTELYSPDWVAGMFMIFPMDVYRQLSGFNTHFFLYYEDVDLCSRCWLSGHAVVVCPKVVVTHDAQRTSHGNLKYLYWHLSSMIRFFLSRTFFRIRKFHQTREIP